MPPKKNFIQITGVSNEIANQYLKKYKQNLGDAVEAYLSEEEIRSKSIKSIKYSLSLISVFDKYKDPNDPNKIDIDGTMEYLSDLGIEPEDLKSLVLAYFLQSPSMGVFPRASFLSQWHKYKISSIKDMKTFIGTYFRNVINGQDDPKSFQKLYNFTFGFLLENENQKLLDYELVIEYWKLLLPLAFINNPQQGKFNKRLDQWYDFLGNEYKRPFSKDMWSMFYLFVEEVIFVDPVGFKEYDEMAAWPSVMDEYVEYLTEGELLEQRT